MHAGLHAPRKMTKSRIYIYTLNVKSKCQGTTQPYWKSDLKSPKVQLYIVQKWMHHVHFPSNQIIFFFFWQKAPQKDLPYLLHFYVIQATSCWILERKFFERIWTITRRILTIDVDFIQNSSRHFIWGQITGTILSKIFKDAKLTIATVP